jgi:hypothetical protein
MGGLFAAWIVDMASVSVIERLPGRCPARGEEDETSRKQGDLRWCRTAFSRSSFEMPISHFGTDDAPASLISVIVADDRRLTMPPRFDMQEQ